MPQIAQTDDVLSIEAAPLRLAFRWDGLRWRHELLAADRRLASSVEWDSERDDPTRVVSPAFQQLSLQEAPAGPQALLVGQWGNHHCSGVFTVTEDHGGAAITVDVAVRSRSGLRALASTYAVDMTS